MPKCVRSPESDRCSGGHTGSIISRAGSLIGENPAPTPVEREERACGEGPAGPGMLATGWEGNRARPQAQVTSQFGECLIWGIVFK